MFIQPIPPNQPTFGGYNFKLKKLYRQGKLPKDLIDMEEIINSEVDKFKFQ